MHNPGKERNRNAWWGVPFNQEEAGMFFLTIAETLRGTGLGEGRGRWPGLPILS